MNGDGRFFDRAFRAHRPIRLIDEDPALFAALPAEGQQEAHARAVAPAVHLTTGPWEPDIAKVCDEDSCLGLLVLDGLLTHSVVLASQPRSEILGPGDVLRPWQEDDGGASVPFSSEWRVVAETRLAVLDTRTLAFACRWPKLTVAIVERTVRRSHWLALQLAIADLRRVDDRLMQLFWHLADRWGRVAPEGVVVPVPLTHEVISQLVCAQRPSVTSSLKRLSDAGKLRRRADRTWLLAAAGAAAPPAVARPAPAAIA